MLLKTIKKYFATKEEMGNLKSLLKMLEWDDVFDMYSRRAFIQYCEANRDEWPVLAFIDIDEMNVLNKTWGYDAVNAKIRKAFKALSGSAVCGRWFSGDEIAIAFKSHEEANAGMRLLKSAAAAEGFDFTHFIDRRYSRTVSIAQTVAELASAVADAKSIKKASAPAGKSMSGNIGDPKSNKSCSSYKSFIVNAVKADAQFLPPEMFA